MRRVSPELAANIVGLISLAGLACSVGGILGCWWVTGIIASVFGVAVSYIAQSNAPVAAEPVVDEAAERRAEMLARAHPNGPPEEVVERVGGPVLPVAA